MLELNTDPDDLFAPFTLEDLPEHLKPVAREARFMLENYVRIPPGRVRFGPRIYAGCWGYEIMWLYDSPISGKCGITTELKSGSGESGGKIVGRILDFLVSARGLKTLDD